MFIQMINKRIIDYKIPVNSTPNFTTTFGNGDIDNLNIRGAEQVNSSLGRYPYFARNGVKVSISADVPSTPQSMQGPLFVVQCAVTLKDASDPDSRLFPENRKPMTVEEAIKAITIDAAWQLGMDDKIGSIEKGKLADLVILEESPFEVAPEKIKNIKVKATIMDGQYTHKEDNRTAYFMVKDEHFAPMPAELKGCDHGSKNHSH